ncbi:tetratricopeptide repeat protein [Alkalicoccus urumqiensis]|uniref:Tetratricopeptide repeat protein n=1 Tax=Alkalicoccus urumqiensis TaxID=1548213 RepID=A0A2P6MF66_ALKUR|nr:tetratricopeptide repeat protein [Alkalicoccus urumqiensis]PRO64928.1 hypothetical protein C6I21_12350 [Alkalicoccus urumqiensis]
MKKEERDDNVVLFPGLLSRLVERGMTALKEKRHYDAASCFRQVVEMEPTHSQARYGLVIAHIEMNQLETARSYCLSMLEEGLGDYYEVLQVYISILVQLGSYQEVVDVLEGVIEEDRLPSASAEHFYQLLDFARQMTGAETDIEEEEAPSLPDPEILTSQLYGGSMDQQIGAVQQLGRYPLSTVEQVFAEFLIKEDQSPVLKSYILQLLKELGSRKSFDIHKFGRLYTVQAEELEDVFHESFGTRVLESLNDKLGQKDPMLQDMVEQLWWHYLFALYPETPEPLNADIWVEALLHTGRRLLHGEEAQEELNEDVLKASARIEEIEKPLLTDT